MKAKTKYSLAVFSNKNTPTETLFKDVCQSKEKQQQKQDQETQEWIMEQTYQLFQQKSVARRWGQRTAAQQLGRLLRRSLQQDRQEIFQKVADEAQAHFAANDTRQTHQFLQNWYKQRNDANKPNQQHFGPTRYGIPRLIRCNANGTTTNSNICQLPNQQYSTKRRQDCLGTVEAENSKSTWCFGYLCT
jgi:hypothetical protein